MLLARLFGILMLELLFASLFSKGGLVKCSLLLIIIKRLWAAFLGLIKLNKPIFILDRINSIAIRNAFINAINLIKGFIELKLVFLSIIAF